MLAVNTSAQESIRLATASKLATEAQRTTETGGYYNIHTGPLSLRFQGTAGVEYNDRPNYASVGENSKADVIFSPGLNTKAYWPVTERNALSLSMGVGYLAYIRNPGLSRFTVNSDSGLNFKVYSGDFVFDVHERFSLVNAQAQDPTVGNSLNRLENTCGLWTDWHLGELILSLGYDHDLYSSLSGNFQYSDNNQEIFSSRATYLINALNQAGLEAGGGLTTYDQNVLNNNTHYSIGPFYEAQLTSYLKASARAGLVSYQFGHNGTTGSVADFTGWYALVSLTHRLNDSFSHSLSGGRLTQGGITANLTTSYTVNYAATLKLIRAVTTSFGASFMHGNTFGGTREAYDTYSFNVGASRRITEKIGGSLTYIYTQSVADPQTLSYAQNRIMLQLTYDF